MKWNDELCGHVVTPEGWAQGIVDGLNPDGTRAWEQCGVKGHYVFPVDSHPIYPPRGWHGLSEREIFDAVHQKMHPQCGIVWIYLLDEAVDDECRETTWKAEVKVDRGGIVLTEVFRIWWCSRGMSDIYGTFVKPEKLITALSNAQVLSERLRGEK